MTKTKIDNYFNFRVNTLISQIPYGLFYNLDNVIDVKIQFENRKKPKIEFCKSVCNFLMSVASVLVTTNHIALNWDQPGHPVLSFRKQRKLFKLAQQYPG